MLHPRSLTDEWGSVNTSGLPLQGASLILCQSLWDLWWREWHWDGFVSQYYSFCLPVSFYQCSILSWLAPVLHGCNNSRHPSIAYSTDQFSNVMILWNEQCENVISCLLFVSTGMCLGIVILQEWMNVLVCGPCFDCP